MEDGKIADPLIQQQTYYTPLAEPKTDLPSREVGNDGD
jgi:hypothetical protein